MLLRASLPESSGTREVLCLFQILWATPQRQHSKSFAIRYLRFLIIRLSFLVAALDKGQNHEQATLLVVLDILKMLAMPVAYLQRNEVSLIL